MEEVGSSSLLSPTKKGLSEHCCIEKRYSDSFCFTERRDAKPEYLEKAIGGTIYKAIKVSNKTYIPNESITR